MHVRPRRTPWWREVLEWLTIPLLALAAVLFLTASPAGASVVHTGPAHDTTTNVVLALPWLTLLVGSVIPLAVNLLTSSNASSGLKVFLNLLLSAVTAGVNTIIDSGGVFVAVQFLGAFIAVFLTSQASHAVWKSTAVEAKLSTAVPGGLGGGSTWKQPPPG